MGFGPGHSDGVLLLGTTMEAVKCLGSEPEKKAWLNTIVMAYVQHSGILLSAAGTAGGSSSAGAGAMINGEEFLNFQAKQEQFAIQHVKMYMHYLKCDTHAGDMAYIREKAGSAELQAKLDSIAREHGDTYIEGIQPVLDPLKAHHFDSSWNWVHQDALVMFYDIIFGHLTTVEHKITTRCISLLNCADPKLLMYMQDHINQVDPSKGETYQLAKQFGQQLIENTREVIGQPPMYKDGMFASISDHHILTFLFSDFPYSFQDGGYCQQSTQKSCTRICTNSKLMLMRW